MRIALIVALLSAASAPALADAVQDAFNRADRIIKEHRLLTPQQEKCSKLILRDDTTKRIAKFGVYEVHDATCGGDPDAEHRLFDLEINMRSGAAKWDNNTDMEMQPVPRRAN
ncbi:hypothetical protein MXD81_31155 [Microbacteriaceae bacterium K1510]|nr:hypothetical protein [Microbacteriaceae bacterium K1510]